MIQPILTSSGSGMPATVEKRGIGTIVSPWPPSTKAETSSTETFISSARKWRKRALSSTPAMPMTLLCGRPQNWRSAQTIASSGLVMQIDERVRRIGLDALADRRHHFQIDAEKIVAAHAGLARHAGGDDHDIGAFDVGIGIRALELGVEAFDRTGLREVERLALRQAFDDVEEHDVAQLFEADQMRERAADLAAADERNPAARHRELL